MEAMAFLAEVAPLSGTGRTTRALAASADGRGAGDGRPVGAGGACGAVRRAGRGPRVAACGWWRTFAHDSLGVGIDPASVQLSGEGLSAGRALAKHAARVVSARLSDTDGASRVPAGEGRLNVFEYVATALTCGLETPLVIDLREVASPMASAARIIEAAEGGSTV